MSGLFHIEAEQAVLGGLLFDNEHFHLLNGLRGEHFYDPVHGAIFDEVARLIRAGAVADPLTLRDWVRGHPGMTELGGGRYLLVLGGAAARLKTQFRDYAAIVMDLSVRRRLRQAMAEISARAETETGGIALLMEAERTLADLSVTDDSADAWRDFGEVAYEAVGRAEAGEAAGISTGIPSLDECTGGIRPGTLWIVGGASSMGKSVAGQQLAINVASQGYGVGYIHLEMDETSIGLRAASAGAWDMHAGDNPHFLSAFRRNLSTAQWDRMRGAARALGALKIKIDSRPGQTMTQIESRARRLMRKFAREGVKPGALVIDHEGLIVSERPRDSKPAEVGDRAIRLLALAKSLNVGVIALTQLNRDGSRKDGSEALPEMTDLAWSAELERCAEVICLLHRKAYYAERKPESARTEDDFLALRSREALLVVAKSRAGKRDHVKILMDVKSAVMAPEGGHAR